MSVVPYHVNRHLSPPAIMKSRKFNSVIFFTLHFLGKFPFNSLDHWPTSHFFQLQPAPFDLSRWVMPADAALPCPKSKLCYKELDIIALWCGQEHPLLYSNFVNAVSASCVFSILIHVFFLNILKCFFRFIFLFLISTIKKILISYFLILNIFFKYIEKYNDKQLDHFYPLIYR
jgi:hypothetical protein